MNPEPPAHRAGAVEINTHVDQDDIFSRKYASDSGSVPLYPSDNTRAGIYDVRYGEIVMTRTNAHIAEPKVYGVTGLAGAGAEESAQFLDKRAVKAALKSKYQFLGIASTSYSTSTDAVNQGFVTGVAGLHTISIPPGQKFETGCILRAELPDPDPAAAAGNRVMPGGAPATKYTWVAVQEDYKTAGDTINAHLNATLKNKDEWARLMAGSGTLEADKWLAMVGSVYDKTALSVVLGIYRIMELGFLTPPGGGPPVTKDPISGKGIVASPFHPGMSAAEYALTLAELFGIIPTIGSHAYTDEQTRFFQALLRRVLATVHHDGSTSNLLFGASDAAIAPTIRDPRTGDIDTTTRAGALAHKQINSTNQEVGAILQALDEHKRFRIGRNLSGPGRKNNANIVIEKGY